MNARIYLGHLNTGKSTPLIFLRSFFLLLRSCFRGNHWGFKLSVSRTLVIEIATPLIRHQFVSNTNVPAYGSLRISITDSQGGYFLLQKLVFHGAFLPFFQYIFCTARISLVTVYKYGALLYFSWIG